MTWTFREAHALDPVRGETGVVLVLDDDESTGQWKAYLRDDHGMFGIGATRIAAMEALEHKMHQLCRRIDEARRQIEDFLRPPPCE